MYLMLLAPQLYTRKDYFYKGDGMKKLLISSVFIVSFMTGCGEKQTMEQKLTEPNYKEVSVHDPSVFYDKGEYYIIGSHLAFAKSQDFIEWEALSENVPTNTLFEDVYKELEESFEYAHTNTLWASDIQQLDDGKYYLYYCLCEGSSPLSTLGVAVADSIEGPYEDKGIFLTSGTVNIDDEPFDATDEPNVIDPHVFYDAEGKLWMVYGSYSGGIFILEMDPTTGFPLEGEGYGTKLLGGNHSRIEAPYILYNEETEYYYLFVTYGGLDSFGGYNIRVSRSKNPDGPFVDTLNNPMLNAKGKEGTIFDDLSIEEYGAKLIGNFQFNDVDILEKDGYVSPGHNSAIFSEKDDKYFIIFHTRFPNFDEYHEVRTHQLFFNKNGWPIITPLRYAGETMDKYETSDISGEYKIILHGKDITPEIKKPVEVVFDKKGKIKGNNFSGEWSTDGEFSTIRIDGEVYEGVFISQWDDYQNKQTMTFTGLSEQGESIFAIKY